MAIEYMSTVIRGATWSMNTLPASKGVVCLQKLAALMGAPIGAVGASVANQKAASTLDVEINSSVGASVISAMTERLDSPSTLEVIQLLLTGLRKDNVPVTFDVEFAGNYGALFELVAWSIKINFTSFFQGSPLFDIPLGQQILASFKRQTSTGPSVASS